ncbi:Branched-chain amino acid transport system 2 carrier protein [compost metagenome]
MQHTFGAPGSLLLAGVILLACLTTGVGLVSACSVYFSKIVPGVSYRAMVVILSLFSMAVSNQGLEQLIVVAVPVLEAIYPMAIALVALSLLSSQWKSAPRVFMPVMLVALVFGLINAAQAIYPNGWTPAWLAQLPGAAMGLGWLLPVAATLLACALLDRLQPARA